MLTCYFNKVALPSPATCSRALHVTVNEGSNAARAESRLQRTSPGPALGSVPAPSFQNAQLTREEEREGGREEGRLS